MNTVLLTQRLYFGRPPRYIYSSNSISANSEFSFFPSVLENYTILDQQTVLFDFLLQVQLVLNTKHQPAQVVPVVVLKIHSALVPQSDGLQLCYPELLLLRRVPQPGRWRSHSSPAHQDHREEEVLHDLLHTCYMEM